MRILVVDQFCGLSPYWLQQHPTNFEQLAKEVLSERVASIGRKTPQLLEVDESYSPPWCTTIFRADADGMAEVWKYRWDSSG